MGCGRRRNEAIARLLEIIEKVKQSCIGRTTVDRCHAVRRFRWRSSIHASPPSCIFDSGTWPAGRKIEPVAAAQDVEPDIIHGRSEEHTSELQSLMRISYAVFCW